MKNLIFFMVILIGAVYGDVKESRAKIEQTLGVKGTWSEQEKVLKLTFPRTDVKVLVDNWPLPPFMGLSSWVSFIDADDALMVMGDLVLFEDEVNPIMKTLLDNGIAITALHNHFFYDHPKVYFMHINGNGNEETLSLAFKRTFDQIKSIRAKNSSPASSFNGMAIPTKSAISKELVQKILGVECQEQNGLVKAVIGRTVEKEVKIGKEMGINSWAGFGGTNDQAVVDGDMAVLENELKDVLKALQDANINVVAIHNHMIDEKPRLLFIHFWGKGPVKDLAKGFKKALGKTL